jgi:hypothetical protein
MIVHVSKPSHLRAEGPVDNAYQWQDGDSPRGVMRRQGQVEWDKPKVMWITMTKREMTWTFSQNRQPHGPRQKEQGTTAAEHKHVHL